MSTSFLMSVVSNPPKPPETNAAGTVTKWIPIPTAFPSQDGCANALISARSGDLTGWDPGYAITVDASVKCWPSGATTWWDQSDPKLTLSLGPVVCPEAYYTATSSVKDDSSTLVACCPSDYTFNNQASIAEVAPASQCVSLISAGQVYPFASDFGGNTGWLKTTATATATTSVVGIPFNGWQFKEATTAAIATTLSPTVTSSSSSLESSQSSQTSQIASSSAAATSASPTDFAGMAGGMHESLTTSAKIGIGVGVGVGAILVIGIFLWVFVDPLARFQRRRLADRVEAASRAQGRGPSPPQPPTPPSLRELALNSPTPPSLSPGEQLPMSPLSSEVLSLSSTGAYASRSPLDMTELDHFPAPGPVVGGMGIGRSGSAASQYGIGPGRSASAASTYAVPRSGSVASNYSRGTAAGVGASARPMYSAGEWIHGRSGSQSSQLHHRPSNTSLGGGRPSTSRSNAAAVGLWGIDPTGQGIRSDPSAHTQVQPGSESPTIDAESVAVVNNIAAQNVARSSSTRSARIVTSPLEIAGQRFDMVFEV